MIDTQTKAVSKDNLEAILNEKFQMKTQLEWDSLRSKFRGKKSILSVHEVRPGENIMESVRSGSAINLGYADFDLGFYANNPTKNVDQLPLKNCSDSKAFIEVNIKTNAAEVVNVATSGTEVAGLRSPATNLGGG